jgi:hypothetical protein
MWGCSHVLTRQLTFTLVITMTSKKQSKRLTEQELATLTNAALKGAIDGMVDVLAKSGHDPRRLQAALVEADATATLRGMSGGMMQALRRQFGNVN